MKLFFLGLIVTPFLISCLSAEPEPAPFGDEIPAQNVATALNEPFQALSSSNIKKGEFVHIESNQAISGGTKFVTKDTGITVIDRQESSSQIDFTLAVQEVTYSTDGSSSSTIFQESVSVPKAGASALNLSSVSSSESFPSLITNSFSQTVQASESISICAPTNNPAVTFHNLSVSTSSIPVPSLVQSSSFCANPADCNIGTTAISFDQVVHDGDNATKIHCQFTFSPDVPFLAGQLKQCVTMAIPVEGRSIVVTECSDIVNFKFGN